MIPHTLVSSANINLFIVHFQKSMELNFTRREHLIAARLVDGYMENKWNPKGRMFSFVSCTIFSLNQHKPYNCSISHCFYVKAIWSSHVWPCGCNCTSEIEAKNAVNIHLVLQHPNVSGWTISDEESSGKHMKSVFLLTAAAQPAEYSQHLFQIPSSIYCWLLWKCANVSIFRKMQDHDITSYLHKRESQRSWS